MNNLFGSFYNKRRQIPAKTIIPKHPKKKRKRKKKKKLLFRV